MRRTKTVFLILIVFEILFIASFDSKSLCRAENHVECTINVDKRMELLSAVQILTSWRDTGIWRENYTYKQDMLDYFTPYSNLTAVVMCEELIEQDFSFDAPVNLMLHLSDPPELDIVVPFSDYLVSRAGNDTILEDFVRALREFYTVTNFENFWQSHLSFYSDVEERASTDIDLLGTVQKLENYFGTQQHGYHVVLAPVFLGSYGPRVKVNGSLDVYSVLSPIRTTGDFPVFGAALFHEFAHSFVNPVTEEFRGEFIGPEKLYEPIATEMNSLEYDDWETMINEHLLRAIEVIVYNQTIEITYHEQLGFIYIRPLISFLSEYDSSNETFREFYPQIVDFFNELATQQKPFYETPLGMAIISAAIVVTIISIYMLLRIRKKAPVTSQK